ncbi:MAG: hypothetical protein ABSB63_01395 [Spirochaetia bacterium]
MFGLYSKRLEIVLALVEEVAFHHVDTRIAASCSLPISMRKARIRSLCDRSH